MSKRKSKRKAHHTWEDCRVIPRDQLVQIMERWCATHGDEAVTARGLNRMLEESE